MNKKLRDNDADFLNKPGLRYIWTTDSTQSFNPPQPKTTSGPAGHTRVPGAGARAEKYNCVRAGIHSRTVHGTLWILTRTKAITNTTPSTWTGLNLESGLKPAFLPGVKDYYSASHGEFWSCGYWVWH